MGGLAPIPSRVGIFLLDTSFKVIYSNSYAVEVLGYPEPIRKRSVLEKKIHALLPEDRVIREFPYISSFRSGRRLYVSRAFPCKTPLNSQHLAIAVLIERNVAASVDVAAVAAQFGLTPREQDTEHLFPA